MAKQLRRKFQYQLLVNPVVLFRLLIRFLECPALVTVGTLCARAARRKT
jgi:hypothetical protein